MKIMFLPKICSAAIFGALLLTACSNDASAPVKSAEPTQSAQAPSSNFQGCYTIEQGAPAQIKISGDNGNYVMQMKEGRDKSGTWDQPEKLLVQPKNDGWKHFSTNALNLSVSDVVGEIIARPDGVMALAQIDSAVANTNPFVDSSYVIALMGAVNTIYQVPCDDTRVELATAKE